MAPTEPLDPSNEELLEKSRNGDHHAFRILVERFHGRLLATATGILGSPQDADEVVQESFVRFYRAIRRFEGRSSLGTYLTRITMNEAIKRAQKNRKWSLRLVSRDDPKVFIPDHTQSADGKGLENQERVACIRKAVQSLKPDFRNVVVLRFLNEYSTAECARILQIPAGTVMSRLSRALDKLGPALKHLNDDETE